MRILNAGIVKTASAHPIANQTRGDMADVEGILLSTLQVAKSVLIGKLTVACYSSA
jgi:hypothetical protein